MAISPTQRTLKYLKDNGFICGIVERFISIPGSFGKRIDLFNFIDIIAIKDKQTIGVQSCGQAFADHDHKILANTIAPEWIKGNREIWLIGWRKVKLKHGGKAMRWQPRIKEYTSEDFK